MTKENKELLLKYLCMALPYDCMVTIAEGGIDGLQWDNVTLNSYLLYQIEEEDGLEYIKPYLRPMSSITEEEVKEFYDVECMDAKVGYIKPTWNWHFTINGIDWLNAHHFDFMGLIPKGLAIAVTEDNNPY